MINVSYKFFYETFETLLSTEEMQAAGQHREINKLEHIHSIPFWVWSDS